MFVAWRLTFVCGCVGVGVVARRDDGGGAGYLGGLKRRLDIFLLWSW